MKFCPKCGSMILPKKVEGIVVVECKCGYAEKNVTDVTISGAKKKNNIADIKVGDSSSTLPICPMKCEKCENPECYFWEIQTRASDEPPTRFYKCTKCSHTWREYS